MPFSQSYRDFVMEQLEPILPAVHARNMFGGVGIYSAGIFFALIADDVLYFHTDDTNRQDYQQSGLRQWGKNYYEVPIAVLEDAGELRLWAEKAVISASKKKKK